MEFTVISHGALSSSQLGNVRVPQLVQKGGNLDGIADVLEGITNTRQPLFQD